MTAPSQPKDSSEESPSPQLGIESQQRAEEMQKWLAAQRKVEEEEQERYAEEGEEETKIAVQEMRKVAADDDGEVEGVKLGEDGNDCRRKSVRTAVDAGTRICEESPGQRNPINSALELPAGNLKRSEEEAGRMGKAFIPLLSLHTLHSFEYMYTCLSCIL